MKTSTTSLLIIFLSLFSILAAQPNNALVKDGVMPPPNAAALGKYGDVPVDYVSGLPSIGIPIHTIKEGPISHSIGLSYHGGGIRAAETASWVGLGWSLQGSGMITRTVQGLPDEGLDGYYNNASRITPDDNTPDWTVLLRDIFTGIKDGEPDLFNISAGGVSGKFYFDSLQIPRIVDQGSDLKIEHEYGPSGFESFIVTASNGIRYHFGEWDGTTHYETMQAGASSSANRYSWMLMAIESMDRHYSIEFDYVAEGYNYKSPASGYHAESNDPAEQVPSAFPGSNGVIGNNHYIIQYVNGKRLDKITYSTGVVTFVPGADREDLDQGVSKAKTLGKVKIETGNGSYCYTHDFTYDYFENNLGTATHDKRLQLLSVQEKTCSGGVEKPAHSFTYGGPVIGGKQFLPSRLTKATDHWGFYNGQTTNDNLTLNIPPTTIAHPIPANPNTISYGSADRDSYEPFMLYGALQRITYPTGGYTDFTFEANQVVDVINTGTTTEISNLTTCGTPGAACCGILDDTEDYTFSSQYDIDNAYFDLEGINPFPSNTADGCNTTNRSVDIEIYNGGTLVTTYGFNFTSSGGANHVVSNEPLSTISTSLSHSVLYTFKIVSEDCKGIFNLRLESPQLGDRVVGGLRIKKIQTHDGETSANDIIKEFDYETPGNGLSSGKLYKQPRYFKSAAWAGTINGNEADVFVANFSANSTVPLTAFDGRHLIYRKVTENLNGIGKNIYDFLNLPIQPSDVGTGVMPTMISFSMEDPVFSNFSNVHGTLISSNQYDESGTVVSTKQVQQAGYTTVGGTGYGLRANGFSGGNVLALRGYVYQPRVGAKQTGMVTSTIDGVTTTQEYDYDSQHRFHGPTSMKTWNSDGLLHETKYYYADNYPTSSIRTLMVDANIVGSPYRTEQYVDGNLVNGTSISYSHYSRSFGLRSTSYGTVDPKPHLFFTYERPYTNGVLGTGTWEFRSTVVQYHGYSNPGKGYPKETYTAHWNSEFYEWENGNITQKRFNNYTWDYEYHTGTSMVKKITDIDGQATEYEYDQFGRLETTKGRYSGGVYNMQTDHTYQYQGPGQRNMVLVENTFTNVANSDVQSQSSYQYLDGLGRPIQSIIKGKADNGNDVAAILAYDKFGRQTKAYEPIETGQSTGAFYTGTLPTAYSATTYEASPLSRPLTVTPPDWTSYPTIFSYGTNGSSDVKVNGTSTYYSAGTLMKKTIIDPDGNKSMVFTDKIGRQLMAKMTDATNSQTNETNYIYDDRNRQVMVLPPGTTPTSAGLIYEYEYNGYDQITKKWIPDQTDFIEYRYNDRRLPSATQDPNLRLQNKWMATSYDTYGRAEESGFVTGTPNLNTPVFSQLLTISEYGTTGINEGKIVKEKVWALKNSNVDWLETNYTYDLHGRIATTSGNNSLLPNDLLAEQITMGYDFVDNPTTMTRVHKYMGGSRTIAERNTYDKWGRPVDTYLAMNGGAEKHLSEKNYTIKDQLAEENLGYVGGSQGWLQSVDYSYNTQGWLTGINNMAPLGGTVIPLTICTDTGGGGGDPGGDDPIGEGFTGGNTPLNNSKQLTDPDVYDLFQLSLRYDNPMSGMGSLAPARGNGNISQAIWQTKGREKQTYGYEYDYLNRLTKGNHRVIDANDVVTSESFFNTTYDYDERGNIEDLSRKGLEDDGSCWDEVIIDQLSYDYETNSNRLEDINDIFNHPLGFNENGAFSSAKYNYDANGNMTYDPYKDMHLYYNHLNLPDSIVMPGLTVVNYYTSTGIKLSTKEIKTGATTSRIYLGGLEYLDSDLDAYYHPSARVYYGGTTNPEYQYSIQDHLGNTRVMFADKDDDGIIEETVGEILQEHHYYPFGLEINGPWNNYGLEDSRYRYNGIERNEELGLDMAFFRSYDPAIGRWMQIDPAAEKYPSMSPYNGMGNNPILYSDPMGDTIRIQIGEGQFMNYTAGMQYDGDDDFVGSIINSLNSIASVDAGATVIDRLSSAESFVDFSSEKSTKGGAQYNTNADGSIGGTIKAGKSPGDISDVSHELFHGYQHLAGGLRSESGEVTTGAEVGAYLFQDIIRANLGDFGGGSISDKVSSRERLYNQHYSDLLYGGFSSSKFRLASKYFKSSSRNSNGLYNKYKSQGKALPPIREFLPLDF